ncbi:MAG: DUF4097 family beta strand repeat-containing protein [Acidothermaceae bacterium]
MIATSGRVTALLVGIPFVLAAAGWGAFSMVGQFSQTSEHHEASYAWNGGEISLHASAGYVHVVTGGGSQVAVSYTEHYQLKRPTVTATTADGGVQLNAKCPSGIFANNCEINYTLTVPASAQLVLHTGDGHVSVADVTGALSLDVGNGGISLDNVSGDIVAHTGDGGVGATRLRSTSVQASTGNGGVHLEWIVAPKNATVQTGDGGIGLTVPQRTGPYAVSATTGNGGTQVDVPNDPSSSSKISAHTGNGGIQIAFAGGSS